MTLPVQYHALPANPSPTGPGGPQPQSGLAPGGNQQGHGLNQLPDMTAYAAPQISRGTQPDPLMSQTPPYLPSYQVGGVNYAKTVPIGTQLPNIPALDELPAPQQAAPELYQKPGGAPGHTPGARRRHAGHNSQNANNYYHYHYNPVTVNNYYGTGSPSQAGGAQPTGGNQRFPGAGQLPMPELGGQGLPGQNPMLPGQNPMNPAAAQLPNERQDAANPANPANQQQQEQQPNAPENKDPQQPITEAVNKGLAFNDEALRGILKVLQDPSASEMARSEAALKFFQILQSNPDVVRNPETVGPATALMENILSDQSSLVRQPMLLALEMGLAPAPNGTVQARLGDLKSGQGLGGLEPGIIENIINKPMHPPAGPHAAAGHGGEAGHATGPEGPAAGHAQGHGDPHQAAEPGNPEEAMAGMPGAQPLTEQMPGLPPELAAQLQQGGEGIPPELMAQLQGSHGPQPPQPFGPQPEQPMGQGELPIYGQPAPGRQRPAMQQSAVSGPAPMPGMPMNQPGPQGMPSEQELMALLSQMGQGQPGALPGHAQPNPFGTVPGMGAPQGQLPGVTLQPGQPVWPGMTPPPGTFSSGMTPRPMGRQLNVMSPEQMAYPPLESMPTPQGGRFNAVSQ